MGWEHPKMTARQFAVWCAYLDGEWERPSRADSYQMQTAYEVHHAMDPLLQVPRPKGLADFRLKFGEPAERKPSPAVNDPAVWVGMLGGPGRVRGWPAEGTGHGA